MPKKKPPLRTPQEVTAQSKFKMSSDELSAHYKKHFPLAKEFELAQACISILEAVAERERLYTGGVYDVTDLAKPRFVDKVCSGGFWKQRKHQRRWTYVYFPRDKPGRPSTKNADLFLVSILATQFTRLTGKPSSANYENPAKYTKFGRFAFDILIKAGIKSPHNSMKAFLKARNNLSKSPQG